MTLELDFTLDPFKDAWRYCRRLTIDKQRSQASDRVIEDGSFDDVNSPFNRNISPTFVIR